MPTEITNERNAVAERLAVSPAEAARLAGVGRTTIYEAIGSGALRSLKIGKRRLILIASIMEWLAAAQQAADSNGQRPAPTIQDAHATKEERVHVRANRMWGVSTEADRSPGGEGG